jgi:hypothetical protein
VPIFGAIANAIFGAGDASSLPPATIATGGGAVFLAVSVVALVTIAAGVAMAATPMVRVEAATTETS